jgi:YbgC/YbaW family acyl-CoA thioester hydrolase
MNTLAAQEQHAPNVWTLERRVRWGECDPAGVVYTPRFADFVTEAHLAFFEYLFGAKTYELLLPKHLALPAKALTLEFKQSLWPDECFTIGVSIADIRTRTYDLGMSARSNDRGELFTASFTLICLNRDIKKAVALPDFIRDRLVAFRGEPPAIHRPAVS